MPHTPAYPCRYPGCPNLCTKGRYCDEHAKENSHEVFRGSAAVRGYDKAWQTARNQYLLHNPLCVKCKEQGKLVPATVVDHIIPHRGDKTLFWDKNNWQPLCKSCHDKKTGSGL